MRPPAFSCVFFLCVVGLAPLGCGPVDLASNVQDPGPISGPFAVSDFYTPSGFMGDGMESGFLTASVDEDCKPRPEGAEGNCFRFSYALGEEKWAGVYFQYPANNWGSQPGRSIDASFTRVRFSLAAEYSLSLPEGEGLTEACAESACRAGLTCEAGRCQPAADRALGEPCLLSAECQGAAQCVAQLCVAAGTGGEGAPCAGDDGSCESGLRCGVVEGAYQCVVEGAGDVGVSCQSRNECRAGLYCRGDECAPTTRLGPFNFQVGGVAPTKAGLEYSDPIGVAYFPKSGDPAPLAGPDWQEFSIDLSGAGDFDSLIGAFMWAVPFPNIDDMVEERAYPYLADREKPVVIYLDGVVFE